jgi:hypothetical protein
MASPARAAAVLLLALAACQRVPLDEPEPPEETDTDTDGAPTTGGGDDGSQEPMFGCTPGEANTCPMGQKCTALGNGGQAQNDFQCVNDDGILPPDEDCEPAPGTGQDGCTAGYVCLLDGVEATVGTCLELCSGDEICEPGKCTVSPYTLTPFCADACDPLVPDCPQGRACLQGDDRFVCGMPLEETDIGDVGDNCDSFNLRGCAEGNACLPGALVPDCQSGACCTNVCDLSSGDEQCATPAQCKPLFPEPAPGFEHLGACYVPT